MKHHHLLAFALVAACSSTSGTSGTSTTGHETAHHSGSEATTGTGSATPSEGTTTAAQPASGGPVATATIESRSGSQVTGDARFEERDGEVTVTVNIRGATPGQHGLHLHQNPDCSAADAASAGPHFNPASAAHGGPHTGAHHAGDLGNLTVGADGTGTLTLTTRDLTVSAGQGSVVGRSIVFHAGQDDLTSQPAGNSGARQGCGVISAR